MAVGIALGPLRAPNLRVVNSVAPIWRVQLAGLFVQLTRWQTSTAACLAAAGLPRRRASTDGRHPLRLAAEAARAGHQARAMSATASSEARQHLGK